MPHKITNRLPWQQLEIKINENTYHEIYFYKNLWNIIKFYDEITSNFKVTLTGPAEENRVKILLLFSGLKIFFRSNNDHTFGKKRHGSNSKIWFLKTIAIKKARLKTTYSNNKSFSWSFFKRQKDLRLEMYLHNSYL